MELFQQKSLLKPSILQKLINQFMFMVITSWAIGSCKRTVFFGLPTMPASIRSFGINQNMSFCWGMSAMCYCHAILKFHTAVFAHIRIAIGYYFMLSTWRFLTGYSRQTRATSHSTMPANKSWQWITRHIILFTNRSLTSKNTNNKNKTY